MTEGHPITDGITLLLNVRSLTKYNRRFYACFSGLRTAHALFPSMGRFPDGNERIVNFIVVLRYDIQFVRPTAIENNKRLMYVGYYRALPWRWFWSWGGGLVRSALCFRFRRAPRFCVALVFACGALLGIHIFYINICSHFGPSSDSSFPSPAGAGAGLPLCRPCRTARMAEFDAEEESALSSTRDSTWAASSVPPLAGIAADVASLEERLGRVELECERQNRMWLAGIDNERILEQRLIRTMRDDIDREFDEFEQRLIETMRDDTAREFDELHTETRAIAKRIQDIAANLALWQPWLAGEVARIDALQVEVEKSKSESQQQHTATFNLWHKQDEHQKRIEHFESTAFIIATSQTDHSAVFAKIDQQTTEIEARIDKLQAAVNELQKFEIQQEHAGPPGPQTARDP